MNEVSIDTVWTVAAIIVGFQIGAFSWRVRRELEQGHENTNDPVWLPPADWLNLIGLLVIAGGVFVLPILEIGDPRLLPQYALGLGILVFVGYPFALAAHYGLFAGGRIFGKATSEEQPWAPTSELICIAVVLTAALAYVVTVLS